MSVSFVGQFKITVLSSKLTFSGSSVNWGLEGPEISGRGNGDGYKKPINILHTDVYISTNRMRGDCCSSSSIKTSGSLESTTRVSHIFGS